MYNEFHQFGYNGSGSLIAKDRGKGKIIYTLYRLWNQRMVARLSYFPTYLSWAKH
jgi:hypothetical protein